MMNAYRIAGSALALTVLVLAAQPALAGLILHSTMDDAASIHHPDVAAEVYATLEEAVPGLSSLVFESGHLGTATRFDNSTFEVVWPVDGPVRFPGGTVDFDDPGQDGGRLDFWVKFNQDPHATTANTWLARTNWGERYINYEWSSSGGSADMMIDVYGEIPHNYRTSYEKFRVSPRWWSVYENIQAGEWHVFTFLWRHNGGEHKDEIHLFIDGTQDGCNSCSDFNGNLPPIDSITDFFLSPFLYDDYLLFSVDEVYSFDSWDFGGIEGNFPALDIPEGIVMKYPQDNRGPVWGNPVPTGDFDFEFTVNDYVNEECDCDLYLDDQVIATVRAVSGAHTEVTPPSFVPVGDHTWQVKCDGDRLVGPASPFHVDANVPIQPSTLGRSKHLFKRGG